jgi:ribosomal protein S18 acetylase RimI-like enzyme
MDIIVRYAQREDLPQVNQLREMVSQVHVNGRPDVFRPGFCDELKEHVFRRFENEDSDIIVAVAEDKIVGFASVEYVKKPLSPYNLARSFYHIEEFGVDPACRRMGVASALIEFSKNEATQKGFGKIELDMWDFNESALAFYEAVGFKTFRRYMELDV